MMTEPSTRCPRARAHAPRCTGRWGSAPVTSSRAPVGNGARAWPTRRWAPRSKPSDSRSIIDSGDRPLVVIEVEVVDRLLQCVVPADASRPPLLETLEVEQWAHRRVAIVHPEQQPAELFDERSGGAGSDCHVAVV